VEINGENGIILLRYLNQILFKPTKRFIQKTDMIGFLTVISSGYNFSSLEMVPDTLQHLACLRIVYRLISLIFDMD